MLQAAAAASDRAEDRAVAVSLASCRKLLTAAAALGCSCAPLERVARIVDTLVSIAAAVAAAAAAAAAAALLDLVVPLAGKEL